jgi:hypothetical protein
MFEDIVDSADFTLMMDAIREKLGDDAYALADMLAHGLTKKAASRALNRPYPEVRAQVLQIRKVMVNFYANRYEQARG